MLMRTCSWATPGGHHTVYWCEDVSSLSGRLHWFLILFCVKFKVLVININENLPSSWLCCSILDSLVQLNGAELNSLYILMLHFARLGCIYSQSSHTSTCSTPINMGKLGVVWGKWAHRPNGKTTLDILYPYFSVVLYRCFHLCVDTTCGEKSRATLASHTAQHMLARSMIFAKGKSMAEAGRTMSEHCKQPQYCSLLYAKLSIWRKTSTEGQCWSLINEA